MRGAARLTVGGVSTAVGTSLPERLRRVVGLTAAVAHTWWRAVVDAPAIAGTSWRRLVEASAAKMLAALSVRVVVRGAHPLTEGPVLLVANHVSWLDVQALGTIAGPRFVAKEEVRDWPAIGRMVTRLGTIFLKRHSCRDAARVKDVLARALVSGERVAVFPEGTTTDGRSVGPFYSALLQAAVDAAVPVQPVAIRYREIDGAATTAAAFVDDMSFVESLAQIVTRPGLVAELTFGPPIYAADKTRRQLATLCRAFITNALGLEPATAGSHAPRPLRRAA